LRVVVITDRRLGDPRKQLARLPLEHVHVQVREKDLEGRALLALVRDVMSLGAPVWVNDRGDVARIANAHGVHLPEAGLSIADARLAGATRIGCSRHSAADALAADCDLVQLGPIFATPGKGPPLGVSVLAIATISTLVAVGGIDSPERARAAIIAGADAIAVIRAAHDPVLFAEVVAACTEATSCVQTPP
jgi:thiamine-phosphate pyrophosphorylase